MTEARSRKRPSKGQARKRRADRRSRRKARGVSGPLRRLLLTALLVLLCGPALVFLVYRIVPPPITPLMLIRSSEGYPRDYRWTPLEQISPHLAEAVIASEDNLFCSHWGFDVAQIGETVKDWWGKGRLRGASTISMQTTKNLLLWPGRTWFRKAAEAWLTPQLEFIMSKEGILEIYLNVAEMGPGIYGAEAAARHHFGKPAAKLTRREARLLAAILPNPLDWSPTRPTDFLNARVATIGTRVAQLGPMLDCARGSGSS
jgi:monofunctional biosynthetic peptidoglycan transglycosylase